MISGECVGQVRIVKLNRQFEIQSKAAHIPVRAADEAPFAIDRHQFRVIEWRRTSPDADTPTAARAEYASGRPRRPGDDCFGPAKRLHLHAAQSGQLERGDQLLVRQEIGRGDSDRTPRQVDRRQEDENQLIDLLVRPGDDRARRRSAARRPLTAPRLSTSASSPVVNDQSSSNSCTICRTIAPSRRKWVSRTGDFGRFAMRFSAPMFRPPTNALSPSTTRHFLCNLRSRNGIFHGSVECRKRATGTPCLRKA